MNKADWFYVWGNNCRLLGLGEQQAKIVLGDAARAVHAWDMFWEGYWNGTATEIVAVSLA